eukprot:6179430-Pleurochrysis_carterae.AAC.1
MTPSSYNNKQEQRTGIVHARYGGQQLVSAGICSSVALKVNRGFADRLHTPSVNKRNTSDATHAAASRLLCCCAVLPSVKCARFACSDRLQTRTLLQTLPVTHYLLPATSADNIRIESGGNGAARTAVSDCNACTCRHVNSSQQQSQHPINMKNVALIPAPLSYFLLIRPSLPARSPLC